ncbi:MAG: hypothetical protein AB1331_03735 [Bacillota bacterium]
MNVFGETVRVTLISMPVILGFMLVVGMLIRLLRAAFPVQEDEGND